MDSDKLVKLAKFYISTGYKGGSGKTINALAIMAKLCMRYAKVMLIDVNANNADSTAVLTNLYDDKFIDNGEYKKWRFPIGGTKKQLIVVKPNTNKWSGKEIWDFLSSVYEKEKNNASVAVVDTHVSIRHLIPKGEKNYFSSLKFDSSVGFDFFHIWDFAAPDKENEMEELDHAINILKDSIESVSDENFIHVFNPHAAKSPRTFFSRSLRNSWMVKTRKVNKGMTISWETIKKEMENLDLEYNYRIEFTYFNQRHRH